MSDDLRKRVMTVEAAEAETPEEDSRRVGDPLAEAMLALASAIQRLNTYLDRQDGMGELPSRTGNVAAHSPEMPMPAVASTGETEVRDAPASKPTESLPSTAMPVVPSPQQPEPIAFPTLSVRAPARLPELAGDAVPFDTTQPPRFVAMTGIAWPEPRVIESRPSLPVAGQSQTQSTPQPDAMPAIESTTSVVASLLFAMPPLPAMRGAFKPPEAKSASDLPSAAVPPSIDLLPELRPLASDVIASRSPGAVELSKNPGQLPMAKAPEPPVVEPAIATSGQPSPLERWFNTMPPPPSAGSWPSFPLPQASAPSANPTTATQATSKLATDSNDAMLSWFSSPPVTGRESRLRGDAIPPQQGWTPIPSLPQMPSIESPPTNVRDMPPWMQNNTAGTDAHRDILDAMQGFSDATRDFNAKVVAVLAAMTADMRQSHSRLENVDRYFHSER